MTIFLFNNHFMHALPSCRLSEPIAPQVLMPGADGSIWKQVRLGFAGYLGGESGLPGRRRSKVQANIGADRLILLRISVRILELGLGKVKTFHVGRASV
jgi:hypothetical protein